MIRNLYSVILNWYSIDVMLCEKDAQDLCRLSIKLWPWIGTNQRLQLIYMRSFTFLSEDSVLSTFVRFFASLCLIIRCFSV